MINAIKKQEQNVELNFILTAPIVSNLGIGTAMNPASFAYLPIEAHALDAGEGAAEANTECHPKATWVE